MGEELESLVLHTFLGPGILCSAPNSFSDPWQLGSPLLKPPSLQDLLWLLCSVLSSRAWPIGTATSCLPSESKNAALLCPTDLVNLFHLLLGGSWEGWVQTPGAPWGMFLLLFSQLLGWLPWRFGASSNPSCEAHTITSVGGGNQSSKAILFPTYPSAAAPAEPARPQRGHSPRPLWPQPRLTG